ncbi:hypothetical protein CQ10_38820 [Bradyrhizobium valentinum]|nr:hypothetical protein CQ10_38820 [Bradyrhizobium valentinum]
MFCIGAHSDDINIGVGATVLRILHEGPDVEPHDAFCQETRRALETRGEGRSIWLRDKSLILASFTDTLRPEHKGADQTII